jgi:hypothetical protein
MVAILKLLLQVKQHREARPQDAVRVSVLGQEVGLVREVKQRVVDGSVN